MDIKVNDSLLSENRRLDALKRLNILDTSPDPALDRVTRLAKDMFGVEIALISLVDEHRQWFKSRHGLNATETPREHAFCAHTIQDSAVMVVDNATQDDRFSTNPLVLGDPNIRFYAGAPLELTSGDRIGTLCVIDPKPRTVTPDEAEKLQMLAQTVVDLIELQQQQIDEQSGSEEALERELIALTRSQPSIFRFAAETCADGAWFCDPTAPEKVWLSEKFWENLGYHPDQKNHTLSDWLSVTHSEDQSKLRELITDTNPGYSLGTSKTIRFVKADGDLSWLQCRYMDLTGQENASTRQLGIFTDISKNIRAEQKAVEQAQFTREVLNGSAVTFVTGRPIIDEEGSLVDCRMQTVSDFREPFYPGYDPNWINDELLTEAIKGNSQQVFLEYIRYTFASGHATTFESSLELMGEDVPVQVSVSKLSNGDLLGSILSIKALKDQQKELEEKTRRLKKLSALNESILESSIAGIMSFEIMRDDEGEVVDLKFVAANPAVEKLVGRTPEQLLQTTLLSEFPGNKDEGLYDKYVEVALTGEPAFFEIYYNHDNVEDWFSVSAVQTGENGVTVTFSPITTQKKAEKTIREYSEQLQAILDNLPAIIFVKDDKNRIINLNRRAAESMGYDDPKQLENTDTYELFPDMAAKYHADDLAVISSGIPIFDMEEAYTPLNGAKTWISTSKVPLDMPDDEKRLLVVIHDITDRKQREVDLERLNKSLQEFAYIAAHDLQAPLRQTAMFSEILESELKAANVEFSEDTWEMLSAIIDTVSNMRAIVRSLYDLARLESEEIETSPSDLNDILRQATEFNKLQISESQAKLECETLPMLPVAGEWIERVFANIISNACKYAGIEHPVIRVRYTKDMPNLKHKIIIEDNGVGVPEFAQQNIFKPFQRAANNSNSIGAGIGLSLCKRIMALHKGDLVLDPHYTDGARFVMTLPILDDA